MSFNKHSRCHILNELIECTPHIMYLPISDCRLSRHMRSYNDYNTSIKYQNRFPRITLHSIYQWKSGEAEKNR